jgi:hypothetical protein
MISLAPSGNRIKIGRQTNTKTVPGERNGYFDSKVLSRQHAEVWEEGGKVSWQFSSTLAHKLINLRDYPDFYQGCQVQQWNVCQRGAVKRGGYGVRPLGA